MMIGKLKAALPEHYFFLAITFLNLIPVLVGKFFPTMDGAAHLYNSNIINELVFKGNDGFASFFTINPLPVPNWTGHFILSFFNLFLPAFLAEKILVLFYLTGLPYAFRRLVKTISPDTVLLLYLIFPFTYSFLFLLGFYNFSLALVFLFITLSYWIKNEQTNYSPSKLLTLFLLLTLTYFSHVFVFGILLFLIAAHTVFTSAFLNGRLTISGLYKKLKILALASLLPLLLFSWYFLSSYFFSTHSGSDKNTFSFAGKGELVTWLTTIRPIITYNPTIEEPYTKTIAAVFLVLLVAAVYVRIKAVKGIFNFTDFWLFSAGVVLALYFTLPDSHGSAGFISIRLGLLFYLLLLVWLATQKIPKVLCLAAVAVVFYCNLSLNYYYSKTIWDLNKVAKSCREVSEHLVPNSLVLPLNYSGNWMMAHFSNYMGTDKPVIILENYECGTRYFPVTWNEASLPNSLLGNVSHAKFDCLYWETRKENPPRTFDYVFVLGDMDSKTDSCTGAVRDIITEHYDLVFRNEHCKLFEKKKL